MTINRTQAWDPDQYQRIASFVPELGEPLLDWLQPTPGQRVLDLGCGDGSLTAKLLEFGCEVVGVDSSPEMAAAANARGIDARVADAAQLEFEQEFDAVFSNAALHWMQDYRRVLTRVARALKPGGRFIAELGGYGNVAAIEQALQAALLNRGVTSSSPWFFPKPEFYASELERAGFSVTAMEHFPRPTPLSGEMTDWLRTFGKLYLEQVRQDARHGVLRDATAELQSVLRDDAGGWFVDYVRLRFSADYPG